MNDIRLIYKEKNYLINSNVLKGIKSLNLITDELLLLIYFIKSGLWVISSIFIVKV